MKKRSFLTLCVSLIFTSCSSSNKEIKENLGDTTDQYELVKVDSILVYDLEPLQITDYNPQTQRFLAYGTQSKVCMEIDREGNIIKKVDLTGEGPGHFGQGMSQLGYFDDGIIINGPNVYFTYGKDWDYRERVVYTSGGAYYPVSYISGAPISFDFNGVSSILKKIDDSDFDRVALSSDYFEKAKMIELLSPNKEVKQIITYPANSLYRSNIYYRNYKPIFSVNREKDKLYVALPYAPEILVYDLENDFELIETISLDLKGFKKPKGVAFEDQKKNIHGYHNLNEWVYVYGLINSSIRGIDSKGNITIVEHSTGVTGDTNFTTYEEGMPIWERTNQKITTFFVKDTKVLEVNHSFTRMVRISEHKFLAHYVNDEEELDYNKFYIYELREKDGAENSNKK